MCMHSSRASMTKHGLHTPCCVPTHLTTHRALAQCNRVGSKTQTCRAMRKCAHIKQSKTYIQPITNYSPGGTCYCELTCNIRKPPFMPHRKACVCCRKEMHVIYFISNDNSWKCLYLWSTYRGQTPCKDSIAFISFNLLTISMRWVLVSSPRLLMGKHELGG